MARQPNQEARSATTGAAARSDRSLLQAVSRNARSLTLMLDLLSDHYADPRASVLDPLVIALREAAAAAHDLAVATRTASAWLNPNGSDHP